MVVFAEGESVGGVVVRFDAEWNEVGMSVKGSSRRKNPSMSLR